MAEQFTTSDFIPALPMVVYVAWTDGALRTAITGRRVDSAPLVGRAFSVDDGAIAGLNIELEPGRRIVQSWRTGEFPKEAPDSRVTVTLLPEGNGTRLTLMHQDIPDGHSVRCRDHWETQVFRPMQEFFVGEGVMGAPADAGVAEVNRLVSEGEAGIPSDAAPRDLEVAEGLDDDRSITAGGLNDPGGSISDVNAIGTYASMPGDKPRPGDVPEDPDEWWGHLDDPGSRPEHKPDQDPPKKPAKSSGKKRAKPARKSGKKKPRSDTKKPAAKTKRKPSKPKRKKK